MEQVLNIYISQVLFTKDLSEQLADFHLLLLGYLLSDAGIDALGDFHHERLIIAKLVANASQLILFNFHFVLSILFLDFVRRLLVVLNILVEFVSHVGENDQQEEEHQGEPTLRHGHIAWGNRAEAQIEPDVGEQRCNTCNSKNACILYLFGLLVHCNNGDAADNQQVKCRGTNDGGSSKLWGNSR